jgi:hypothetical protein
MKSSHSTPHAAILVAAMCAFTSAGIAQNAPADVHPASSSAAKKASVHYMPERFPRRAQLYYQMVWGVDSMAVKSVEAGELIRFNYRVLDPARAQPLNDKELEPSLIDERAHVKLIVPTMDKIGKLRQSSDAEAGKTYWMAFSNKGNLVRPGDRVTVQIGKFRADGLVVE